VQAPTANDAGAIADLVHELRDQAGLTDPGRPEQRQEMTAALGRCVLEVLPQAFELAVAADERRVETSSHCRRLGVYREQAVGLD